MNILKSITQDFNDAELNVMKEIPYIRDNFNELLFNSYSDLTEYLENVDKVEQFEILLNSDGKLSAYIDLEFLISDFIDYMRTEFEIPDYIEIDISDQEIEMSPSDKEVVEDLISENKHDNKQFFKHIEHYILKNCLVNGGAIFLLIDIIQKMYDCKPEIPKIFKTFLYSSILMTYQHPILRDSILPTLGESKL